MSARGRLLVVLCALAGLFGTVAVARTFSPGSARQPGTDTKDTDRSKSSNPAGLLFPSPDSPLLFGVKSTLEEAELKAGFHLYRPNHQLANDSLIKNVWVEETSTDDSPWVQVAITYSSGLRMYLFPAWVDGYEKDPRSHYESRVEGLGGRAEAKEVNGYPALVLDANQDAPAAIDLVAEGVRIQIIGGDAPVDATKIIEIAATVK